MIKALPCKVSKKALSKLLIIQDLKKYDPTIGGDEACGCRKCEAKAKKIRWALRMFNKQCGMNYFSFREKEGMISYLPAGKPMELVDGQWARKCRQEIAPGRWAQKVLHPRIASRLKPEDLALFTAQFNAREQQEKISFRETTVKESYRVKKPHSCMTGRPVEEFYQHFDCCAIVAEQHGEIVGRAILWRTVEGQPEPAPLLDRIYPNQGEVTEAMIDFARARGWYYKELQGQGQSSVKFGDKILSCQGWKIPCLEPEKASGCGFFPYLDTFSKSDKELNYLTYKSVPRGWIYVGTGGARERDKTGLKECSYSHEYFEPEEMIQHRGYWVAKIHCVTLQDGSLIPKNRAYKVCPPGQEPFYISQDHVHSATD